MTMVEDLVSYRDILENLSEGVYFTDRERQILYWNRGAESISGYAASEVVGSHCWDNILMHVDHAGRSLCRGQCPLVKAIAFGAPQVTQAFLRHKKGHRVPVVIKTMPIRDAGGAIVGAVELFSDNTAQMAVKERADRLEKLTLLDPLTGLANRRYLDMLVAARHEEWQRYGWPFAISFIDIDDFKRVNDDHGHEFGDEVLRVVCRTLVSSSRSFDIPGRWGGEEFVVVSENVNLEDLHMIADRYRFLIERSGLSVKGIPFHVTVSIGASLVRAGDTPQSLVERADRLMYQSKQRGKNCVTVV